MNEEIIPIAFCPAGVDACALYRMYMPHLNLDKSCFIIPALRLPNGQIAPGGAINVNEIKHCKVVVVQRLVSKHNKDALQTFRKMGMKIVYDLDDDVWNLPAYNPGRVAFTAMREGFADCASMADVLTVSTRGLRSAAKSHMDIGKEIFIVPNAIDLNLFKKKNVSKSDGLTIIGWGGSNTHSIDTKYAFAAICNILDEFPNARMEIVGAQAEDEIEESYLDNNNRLVKRKKLVLSAIAKHKQTRFRPWVPISEYANRLASWSWDIALAPLEDNRFNRSKSNIKVLEAAAMQIPCLASDVQCYREFFELGDKELTWLLCRNDSDWKTKLRELISNPELRTSLGLKMYAVAEKWFNIVNTKEIWKHVFREILK